MKNAFSNHIEKVIFVIILKKKNKNDDEKDVAKVVIDAFERMTEEMGKCYRNIGK